MNNHTTQPATDATIVAISTPPGMGGIAIARVSGPEAIDIVTRRWKGTLLTTMQSHTAHYGQVVDTAGALLDEVVLTLYRAPHSFTGEDVVEISCHGSRWIQQQLVTTLIDAGCRSAQPGEFTRRAFANGRLDLSQAEAVADVIASTSRASHRVAMNQMRGRFAQRLNELRDELIRFVSLIELELDFSEEDVTFADRREVVALAQRIKQVIDELAGSFDAGNVLRHGVPVAIVGQTNAGKSTLLNALLHDDRALVSDIHGTTRDLIEDTVNLSGTLFRFIDTAGLRHTDDVVENMGIDRSLRAIDRAQLVLWVIDATTAPEGVNAVATEVLEHAVGKQLIAVVNKSDLAPVEPVQDMLATLLPADARITTMSAHDEEQVKELERLIVEVAALPQVDDDAVIVTNVRHYEALTRAGAAIDRALQGLESGLSGDLVSQDIRECLHHLGTITGAITSTTILNSIFENFCIGK